MAPSSHSKLSAECLTCVPAASNSPATGVKGGCVLSPCTPCTWAVSAALAEPWCGGWVLQHQHHLQLDSVQMNFSSCENPLQWFHCRLKEVSREASVTNRMDKTWTCLCDSSSNGNRRCQTGEWGTIAVEWGTIKWDQQKQNLLLLHCGCDRVVLCNKMGALLAMNGSPPGLWGWFTGSQDGCGPNSGKPKCDDL
jgi:hypothetical protein